MASVIIKILSVVLLALGLLSIYANYELLFKYYLLKQRDRNIILIPIMGGLFTCIGMILWGSGLMRSLAFIPLFIDIACLPMILLALYRVFIAKGLY